MTTLFTFFAIISIILPLTLASEIINCSPPRLAVRNGLQRSSNSEPTIYFLYDRDSLGVYPYQSEFANLSLSTSTVTAKVSDSPDSNTETAVGSSFEKSFDTFVYGAAKISETDDGQKKLKDCNFFIMDKKTKKFYDDSLDEFDSKVFKLAEECLELRLCDSLGPIKENDTGKAGLTPTDFSLLGQMRQKNRFRENSLLRINAAEAVDSIIKEVADKFKAVDGGRVIVPNAYHLIFKITDGHFEGLGNLRRFKEYPISESAAEDNPRTFTFTFGIPTGHVEYTSYAVLGAIPWVGHLCAEVTDLTFTAKIAMNFEHGHCHTTLVSFETNKSGKSKTHTCGFFGFLPNPLINWYVQIWDDTIVKSIARRIDQALTTVVYEHLDCHNF